MWCLFLESCVLVVYCWIQSLLELPPSLRVQSSTWVHMNLYKHKGKQLQNGSCKLPPGKQRCQTMILPLTGPRPLDDPFHRASIWVLGGFQSLNNLDKPTMFWSMVKTKGSVGHISHTCVCGDSSAAFNRSTASCLLSLSPCSQPGVVLGMRRKTEFGRKGRLSGVRRN